MHIFHPLKIESRPMRELVKNARYHDKIKSWPEQKNKQKVMLMMATAIMTFEKIVFDYFMNPHTLARHHPTWKRERLRFLIKNSFAFLSRLFDTFSLLIKCKIKKWRMEGVGMVQHVVIVSLLIIYNYIIIPLL